MTIVFRTTWQHYSPGQQADLGSTEETRLIGLGLADDFSQASQDAATSPPGELPVLSAGQYAAPTSMPAGVLYLSPAGAVVVRKPGEAVWSPMSGDGVTGRQSGRSTVVIVGDSFGVRDAGSSGPNWYGINNATSLFYWSNILLGVRFRVLSVLAASGTTPAVWLSSGNIDAALALRPDYLWLTGDGDAADASATAADYIAAYTSILQKAAAVGVRVITHTQPPSTGFANNTVRRRFQAVNNWLVTTAASDYGAIVVDVTGATLLAGSLAFAPNTATLTDGVHYECPGAVMAGKLVANALKDRTPAYSIPWTYMYDGNNVSNVSIIPSPIMNGTGGGVSVLTTSTGIPNGISAQITSGESGTANTIARTDGAPGNWLEFDVAFTAAGKAAEAYINSGSLMGGKAAGSTLTGFAEIRLDPATFARVHSLYFYVEFFGAGSVYASGGDPSNVPTRAMGLATITGAAYADVFTLNFSDVVIPAGTTGFRTTIGVRSAGAGSCKFAIGRVTLL